MRVVVVTALFFCSGALTGLIYRPSDSPARESFVERVVAHQAPVRLLLIMAPASCSISTSDVHQYESLRQHPGVELQVIMLNPPDSAHERSLVRLAYGIQSSIHYDEDDEWKRLIRQANLPVPLVALTTPRRLVAIGGKEIIPMAASWLAEIGGSSVAN